MSCDLYPGFTHPASFAHIPMEKTLHNPAPGVYTFSGYGESNFSIIVGKGGYILVDTGSNAEGAEEALAAIAGITDEPLAAVLLTHSHIDHLLGGEVFLAGRGNDVPVWGRAGFGAEQAALKGLENIAAARAAKQFGVHLPDEKYTLNSMLFRAPGGKPGRKTAPVAPTRFMEGGSLALTIAGIDLELYAAPGETPDHMAVWLPGGKVLFCGDTMYRSFPNIYPLRGTGFRNLAVWSDTAKRLAGFAPDVLVMGHNAPARGSECVEMLNNFAEAVRWVLDETVKGMNAGLSADELAISVQLPAHLRELPYMAEYYGSVPWTVRAVYAGLLGWFDGNPTALVPLPPKEEADRMARMAGGADKLLEQAQAALKERDWRWAARLCDFLALAGDERIAARARLVKADALEALSDVVLPITGKNYLRACAQELRGV